MRRPSLVGRGGAGVVALLALAGFAGACTRELALDDWLRRADALCRDAQAQADGDPAPQSPLPGDALRRLADQSSAELEQLRELPRPEQQGSSVAEYLLTLEHRVDNLRLYGDAVDKAPAQGPAPDRTRLEEVTAQATTQALALGLESCGAGVDVGTPPTTPTDVSIEGTDEPALTPPTSSRIDEEIVTEDAPG